MAILQKIHYHLIGFFLISLQIHRSCSMSRMLFWEIIENFWISYFQEPLCMAAFIMSKKFNYVIYKLLLGNTWSLNCYSSVKTDEVNFKLIGFFPIYGKFPHWGGNDAVLNWSNLFRKSLDIRRRFNVDTTSYDIIRRRIDVITTLCVYGVAETTTIQFLVL